MSLSVAFSIDCSHLLNSRTLFQLQGWKVCSLPSKPRENELSPRDIPGSLPGCPGRGTVGKCTGPKWPKMVQTTILVKMTLFRTRFQHSRDHFGPFWPLLVHFGPPTVLWPFLMIFGYLTWSEYHPTVPEGHKHRVTTPENPRKIPRTPAEPRRDPAETPQNPRRDPAEPSERPPQSALRGKFPRRASRRVVPLGW